MEPKVAPKDNGETNVQSRVFRFVDQTDRSQKAMSEHKAVVRSHVMTEVRRRRRSKLRLEPETYTNSRDPHQGTGDYLSPDRSRWPFPQLPRMFGQVGNTDPSLAESAFPERQESDEPQQWLTTAQLVSNVQNASDLQSLQTSDFQSNERLVGQPCSVNISPTILGASRVDPFRALPISTNREVYELIDNYTVAIPILMYGTHTRKPVHLRLYDVATDDPAAFHAMLAYSARQIDFMGGCQTSKRTLRHSSTTLRLIYERLQNSAFKCADGLVMAVALLAFAERRFGDDAIARQHWLALREIINSSGGIAKLNLNRWLAAVLYWNSLVWSSGPCDAGMGQMKWPSLLVENELGTGFAPTTEFIDFLIRLASGKEKWLDHLHSACSARCLHSCARRRVLFDPEGPLYRVVTPTSFHEAFDDGIVAVANIQRTASICQIPCLLYLNIVMIEYEESPGILEQFLGKLIVCIYKDSLDKDVSAEHLLIRLLGGLEDTTSMLTSRAHKTLRMAAVIQKLGAKAQRRIHRALLEALVYPVGLELVASHGLLFALAESLVGLPRPYCVNDLDRFIAVPP